MKFFFSCYFHPTTFVCIDDDLELLHWLKKQLEGQNQLETFSDPFIGLDYLKSQKTVVMGNQALHNMALSIHKIHELIYDENRSHAISTLVVDYAMPGMDGFSLCRDIQDKPYQKIMLTGKADQNAGVQAFNEGLIQQFMLKGQGDVLAGVQALTQKMQRQFFIDQTQFLSSALLQLEPETFNYFMDAECCEKIYALLAKYQIRELYLFNDGGEYVLMDQYNNLWWLSIKSQRAYQELIQEARTAFLEEPSKKAKNIYALIESGKKLPLFALEAETLDIHNWQDILVKPIEFNTALNTYQVLLAHDRGKAALAYAKIRFAV